MWNWGASSSPWGARQKPISAMKCYKWLMWAHEGLRSFFDPSLIFIHFPGSGLAWGTCWINSNYMCKRLFYHSFVACFPRNPTLLGGSSHLGGFYLTLTKHKIWDDPTITVSLTNHEHRGWSLPSRPRFNRQGPLALGTGATAAGLSLRLWCRGLRRGLLLRGLFGKIRRELLALLAIA